MIADFFSAERVSCVIACFDGLFVDLALRFGLWVKQWLFALREKKNKKKDYDYDYDYYSIYPVVIINWVHYLGPPGPSTSQILGTFSTFSEDFLGRERQTPREDPLGSGRIP